jgi:predicted NBD/HSP70 family sugar kinase
MEDISARNGSPGLMRAINAAHVVRELRARGPMSRASLVRATGLSKPTITNVVADLEALRYIELFNGSLGSNASPGVRAPLYEYCAGRGHVLGIDIGADKTLLLLADLAGTVLASRRLNTRAISPLTPKGILNAVASASAELLADAAGSTETLLSVVVGTPGVVSSVGVVTMAPQLEGWEGLDLAAAMSEYYPCPVTVESEVSLSLQAERWVGVAQGVDDALFVNLGVGVGAALLVDGKRLRGADGAAGEIGLMPLPKTGVNGSVGYVEMESETGGGALLQRGQALARTPEGAALLQRADGNPADVDASIVFAAMRDGDAAAIGLVQEMVRTLAWGISCLVCALNPRVIVIGGGLSRAADVFLGQLKEQVAAAVPFPPEWFVSELGDEAVALGAVNQATAIVERNLFLKPNLRVSL